MSLKNTIKKTFGNKKQISTAAELSIGNIYGVSAGKFVGKFFVYMGEVDKQLHFIVLPDMQIEKITQNKFDIGIQNNILEYQENLPEEITAYCKQQYEKKLNN